MIGGILAVGLVLLSASSAKARTSGVPSYEKIEDSLAFVLVQTGTNRAAYEMAFCIASDDRRSYFLSMTKPIVRASPVVISLAIDGEQYEASVVEAPLYGSPGPPFRLALFEVAKGNVPALTLSGTAVSVGAAVAVVDSPPIRAGRAPESEPRAGTVSRISQNRYIEYQAKTNRERRETRDPDTGISVEILAYVGGPVFDPKTGVVYGIATDLTDSASPAAHQANTALSIGEAIAFLTKAAIPLASPGPDTQARDASPVPTASALPSQ